MNSNDLTYNELPSNPRTPPTNKRRLFPKSDGWYDKNSSGTVSKLATIDDIPEVTAPSYKEYAASLNFGGASAPSVTVFENQFTGSIVWTYIGTGHYRGTLSGAFTENKTYLSLNPNSTGNSFYRNEFTWETANYLDIYTYNTSGSVANASGIMSVLIRVYN